MIIEPVFMREGSAFQNTWLTELYRLTQGSCSDTPSSTFRPSCDQVRSWGGQCSQISSAWKIHAVCFFEALSSVEPTSSFHQLAVICMTMFVSPTVSYCTFKIEYKNVKICQLPEQVVGSIYMFWHLISSTSAFHQTGLTTTQSPALQITKHFSSRPGFYSVYRL